MVMPCSKIIEWIITHMVDSHVVLRSESNNQLVSYYGEDNHTYYTMLRPNKYPNDKFCGGWDTFDVTNVIKKWF